MTDTKNIFEATCHQYKRRLEKQAEEEGLYEPLSSDSLENAWVEPIDNVTAKHVIEEYEYLGVMAAITTHAYGMYFQTMEHGKLLGGVACLGPDYSKNLGVWDKYGMTDNMILLNRGVNKWWCPPNANSWFISRVQKEVAKEGFEVITATVDPMAGEVGTIYQSLNWSYLGIMRAKSRNYKGSGKRFAVIIDGKLYGSRAIRAKLGTQKREVILKHYPQAEFTYQLEKHRYMHFISDKKTNKKNKKAIEHLIEPYPKRGIDARA